MILLIGKRRREQTAFNQVYKILMDTARVEKNPYKLSHPSIHRLKVDSIIGQSIVKCYINFFFLFTDIREVLKDLQMLSASLLGMETSQVTITDPQNKT